MDRTVDATPSVERLEALVADLQTVLNRADRATAAELGIGSAEDLQVLRLLLAEGPLRVGELAKRRASSMTTVSGRLNRLEKRDLVVRRRISGDRRAMEVSLTDAGIERAQLSRQRRLSALENVAADHPSDALADLVRVLGRP